MTRFLADPQPFIDGTKDITKIVAESVGNPLAQAAGEGAKEVARQVNWTLIILVFMGVGVLFLTMFAMRRKAVRVRKADT